MPSSAASSSAAASGALHRAAPRDERDVVAAAYHGRLADRNHVVSFRHLSLEPPDREALDHDDRPRVSDGGLQQSLRVRGRGGHDDLQPRHVRDPGLQRLPVLRSGRAARTVDRAHHHRGGEGAVGDRRDLRRVVDELVGRKRQEVEEHDLDDRSQPRHRGADRRAHEGALADRRVAHAYWSEAIEQAARREERAAGARDVLAEEHDRRVAVHLLGDRVGDRFAVLQDHTCSRSASGAVTGAASARSAAACSSASTSASISAARASPRTAASRGRGSRPRQAATSSFER